MDTKRLNAGACGRDRDIAVSEKIFQIAGIEDSALRRWRADAVRAGHVRRRARRDRHGGVRSGRCQGERGCEGEKSRGVLHNPPSINWSRYVSPLGGGARGRASFEPQYQCRPQKVCTPNLTH